MLHTASSRVLPHFARPVICYRCIRSYSDIFPGKPSKEWLDQRAAIKHHAAESTDLWRKISFYVAVPATILTIAWVLRVEADHAEHKAHIIEENGGEMPPIPEYEYLNKRSRPFPWGMNSLFFNARTQKNMEESAD